jgi:hypothetical protein
MGEGGGGGRGCFLQSPEDLLIKKVRYTSIIIKSTLAFLLKTSETKKFLKIFCEEFFILLKVISVFFSFKIKWNIIAKYKVHILYTLIAYLCYVTFHYCQDTLSCCGSGAEK